MNPNEVFDRFFNKITILFLRNLHLSGRKMPDLNLADENYLELIFTLEQPTFSELAEAIGVTKSAVTYAVNRLINTGYVSKKRSDEDKRVYYLKPTKKALEYYAEMIKSDEEVVNQLLNCLTEEEQTALVEILSKIEKNIILK